jgi:hypothetical protein
MNEIPVHLRALFDKLVHQIPSLPPAPWRKVGDFAVGGLTDVGFADSSDLLLVISSTGRGLFDCRSGEQIARDSSEDFEFNTANLYAQGIGPLAGQRIRTAGLHGGGLAVGSDDLWKLDLLTLSWPHQSLFLTPPGHWIYGPAFNKLGTTTKLVTESEFRTFGFSPSGQSFIYAISSGMTVFSRA